MELLNLSFAILIIEIAICILPGVLGIVILVSSEEKKRETLKLICRKFFGFSDAISYSKFLLASRVMGSLLVLFSLVASGLLLLYGMGK